MDYQPLGHKRNIEVLNVERKQRRRGRNMVTAYFSDEGTNVEQFPIENKEGSRDSVGDGSKLDDAKGTYIYVKWENQVIF